MPLAPGDTFAGYTIVRQLGSGGMGAVYLVEHPRLPRRDALKLLRAELTTDPDFARRFLNEADVVAQLAHHNIVSVHDRGEYQGQLWLTMQYIDGIDAEQALADAGGLLPPGRVAHIITEVAAALDAAHRRNVVHRDVKPANILLAPSPGDDAEQVFLTDFGIAKSLETGGARLTRTGAVLATFDYASPEQIESREPDARSDIYSLGCVLHKLLTGSVPFPGEGVAAAIHGHLQLPPPRPSSVVPWLAPRIDDVVARAMDKDPDARFPSCRSLAAAAASALVDYPAPPSPPYTLQLSRSTGAVIGPMTTDRLSTPEIEQLVDLVRRTRFFDLPEDLHQVVGRSTTEHRRSAGRPVSVEIRAGRTVRRVAVDLEEARRPEGLADLVEVIERLPRTPDAAPEPATALHDLRAAGVVRTPPVPPSGRHRVVPAARTTDRAGTAEPPPPPPPAPPQPGPPDPGWPATPWTPVPIPPPERHRGRLLLIAGIVALLVAAGVVAWLVTRTGDTGGGPGGRTSAAGASTGSSAAGSTTVGPGTTPAERAYLALPHAGALPASALVVPRDVDGNVDLYVVDADSGATGTRLTTAAEPDGSPQISPDRTTVLFLRKQADGTRVLMTVATDGTGERPVFSTPLADCPDPRRPAWNRADPTQLVLRCSPKPGARVVLVTFDGAAKDLDLGVPRVGDVSISPDGTRLVYWGTDDAQADGGALYVMPLDGSSGPTRLTDGGPGIDADPVWSPDGSQIVFRREVGDGQRRVLLMGADGQDVQQLTDGPGLDQDPTWSPDGTRIAFKSDRPVANEPAGEHTWIVDRSGGGLLLLDDQGHTTPDEPAWGDR